MKSGFEKEIRPVPAVASAFAKGYGATSRHGRKLALFGVGFEALPSNMVWKLMF
jgi:hypothetical protein